MPVQLTPTERDRLGEVDALLRQGVGADRAFRIIRDRRRLVTGDPSPVRRSVIRERSRIIRQARREQREIIPTQRSGRLKATDGISIELNSPVGNRWLIDYTYQIENTLTGEKRTVTNTIGTRRLGTVGQFLNEAEGRIEAFNRRDDERYFQQFERAVPGTARLKAFFRTQNK